ncbi:MAG: hypothetical protein KJ634_03535 [Gammaproteobacteria bacterium]|nr:hypothetical protein [Gammaproteobacteria bacterium]MBU1414676.1 hypothetical protein [Gammaproteobacteria bacterium]
MGNLDRWKSQPWRHAAADTCDNGAIVEKEFASMKLRGIPKLPVWQWLVIAVVLAFAVDWLVQRPDSRAREINAVIAAEGSEALHNYPYQFRVLRVSGKTAVLSTPRNVSVPAFRFLGAIHPEIDTLDANNPAFVAVEKELAAVQSEALKLVMSQPDIERVQWELDKTWLANHGIDVPD